MILALKENETMNTSGKYLEIKFLWHSNTSKTEKLKSLVKRQKLKIFQELWAFS